jgi:flavin reductase (DIM6/NTAB) family NADH-FMN oxidoreductase RutF
VDDVEPLDLRVAMAHLASGVCLVSTRDVVGRDCALTVTSVASLSLRPPLVLVAVKRGGFLHDALDVADGWAVTILAADQVDLARYAARHRYPSDTDDFSSYPSRRGQASGALYFTDGLAALECRPVQLVPAGDHSIAIGEVVAMPQDCTGEQPLLYHRRAYRGIGPEIAARESAPSSGGPIGAQA